MSTDPSLQENAKREETPVARKNLSNKFQPNPFNKFFGPRKQRTTPVDMGNFSSWKNKNYREAEQRLTSTPASEQKPAFSIADYMNKNTSGKTFSDVDQIKVETQKPITQLKSDDPTYKKYSLDSYLHKLEQQSQVKSEFEENGDILEPLVDVTMQEVVPTSSQDEVFGQESAVKVEEFSFDDNFAGEKFAFEREELDKVRSRLDKLERESQNIKEKQTQKVISSNELSTLTTDEEDDFDFSKLGIEDEELLDDIEKVNDKFGSTDVQAQPESSKSTKRSVIEINRNENIKPRRKTQTESVEELEDVDVVEDDLEIVKTTETSEIAETDKVETSSDDEKVETDEVVDESEKTEESSPESVVISGDTTIIVGGDTISDDSDKTDDQTEKEEFVKGKTISREDLLTKDDLRTITDEFMAKFTEMYQKNSDSDAGTRETHGPISEDDLMPVDSDDESIDFVDEPAPPIYGDPYGAYGQEQLPEGYMGYGPAPVDNTQLLQQQQNELQAKIIEMLESNKKSDFETEEKLRLAKLENERMVQEYETRLRELETSFRKRDEEMKKQAYLDKLRNDIKLKKAETSFRKKEEEFREMASASSEKVKFGVMLRKELENNLNISNLEMDKKLLEVASKNKKKQYEEELAAKDEAVRAAQAEVVEEEVEEEEVVEKPKKTTTKKTTTRRRTTAGRSTNRSRSRTPRRKIDSDIIGGIDFE